MGELANTLVSNKHIMNILILIFIDFWSLGSYFWKFLGFLIITLPLRELIIYVKLFPIHSLQS